MTEKQEKILNAALELFANEGFKATSTSKVAKKAGVSEGLIFRHYGNKDGLLNAIIKMGEERVKMLFAEVVLETQPKEVLRKMLQVALDMVNNEASINFWKLQYKIKWELEQYGEHKMEAIQQALFRAFKALKFEDPNEEANSFLLWMDGLATRFYLQPNYDINPRVAYIKKKYSL